MTSTHLNVSRSHFCFSLLCDNREVNGRHICIIATNCLTHFYYDFIILFFYQILLEDMNDEKAERVGLNREGGALTTLKCSPNYRLAGGSQTVKIILRSCGVMSAEPGQIAAR